MKREQASNYLLLAGLLLGGGLVGFLATHWRQTTPHERTFTVTAHKYAYEPSVLQVNRGDRVHIRLQAADVTHGFYLEGYDLDTKARPGDTTFLMRRPSEGGDYKAVQEISFVASRSGKFHYRCSQTCGYMHPFMQGELIVSPNYLYSTSVGMTLGLGVGMLLLVRRSPNGERAEKESPEDEVH